MIKKLQIKFMIINMSLVSLVLIGIFIANTVSTTQQISSNSYSSLNESKKQIESIPINNNAPKTNSAHKAFPQDIIWLKQDNSIIEVLNEDTAPDYSDEYIAEIFNSAIEDGKDRGILREYNLRYIKQKLPNDSVIGFIDISYEQSFINKQVINYLLIGLASLATFFVISYFLSKSAIKPVAKAFNQQQQFISDVSHELKTPITVILANASIMKTEETDKKSKWLDYIEKEANRMKKLVDELLFLTRMDEADKLRIQSKLNLSDTLFSCILPFEPVAFESGITIDNDIADDIYIKGNSEQIKRLILILVDNACKYSNENSTISISLKSMNNKAVLSVNNEGKPIPPDDIDKIFDRFYRVDKARERKNNSYGLGLSMAQKIIQAHNGEIKVSSNDTDGTTFTVLLNLVSK